MFPIGVLTKGALLQVDISVIQVNFSVYFGQPILVSLFFSKFLTKCPIWSHKLNGYSNWDRKHIHELSNNDFALPWMTWALPNAWLVLAPPRPHHQDGCILVEQARDQILSKIYWISSKKQEVLICTQLNHIVNFYSYGSHVSPEPIVYLTYYALL